jgi:RNA polymerase sigma-70 factor (ECF subfamily)
VRFAIGRRTQARDEESDDLSDERLLVLRAQQTPRAFEPLYLRYRDPVINYCYYRLGDRDDAEDAASTIFINALRGLAGFRDHDGSFRTWLFRIAHNEVVDQHRLRARHPMAPIDLFHERPSTERSPEDMAADADAHERVRALLANLPPREREVLALRAADLDTNQIASVLGVTAQNVRSIQCRALPRLRALIRDAGLLGDLNQGVADER